MNDQGPSGVNPAHSDTDKFKVVSAKSARGAATHMDIGNIIAMLMPVPLGILWMGGSMLVYALHKHHPNPKVGHYIQWAAYRFYAVVGAIVPIATFFPGKGINHWLVSWGIAALIIIPWSIWSLAKIRRDDWEDVVLPVEEITDV